MAVLAIYKSERDTISLNTQKVVSFEQSVWDGSMGGKRKTIVPNTDCKVATIALSLFYFTKQGKCIQTWLGSFLLAFSYAQK